MSRDEPTSKGPDDGHIDELRMEARYHRDRHRLYAARLGGTRPVSLAKLERLKRARELAESRLRRAQAERAQDE